MTHFPKFVGNVTLTPKYIVCTLVLISISLLTKFEVHNLIHSKAMIGASKFKMGHMILCGQSGPNHAHFGVV